MTDQEDLEGGASDEVSARGEITIVLARGPVTQQAPRPRKDELLQDLQRDLRSYDFLLTGDVQIELEWLVHERLRYESDETADVDNILKPTLDALCGPDGILLDDCQVQSISSTWIDWIRNDQQLTLRIRHEPYEVLARGTIAFVDLGQNLYIPLSVVAPVEFRAQLADTLARAVALRDKALAMGMDFHVARMPLPAQRLFHRSRIKNFRICTLDEYASERL